MLLNLYTSVKLSVLHLKLTLGHDPVFEKDLETKAKEVKRSAEEIEKAKEFKKQLRIEQRKHQGEMDKAVAEAGQR